MMKKILLVLVILLSLGWIAFFSLDTLGVSNTFDPIRLFGVNDGAILVVNRQNEVLPGTLQEFEGSPCEALYNDLSDSAFSQSYISLTLPHLLLINKAGWSSKGINHLFKTMKIKNLLESEGTFEVAGFEGRYKKQGLYLFKKGSSFSNSNEWSSDFDKKASAAIIDFSNGSKTTDIYLKGTNRFDYITKSNELKASRQIRDEELFSMFISSSIQSYHFYEREYYGTIDSVYANGPLYEWLNNGFVIVSTPNGKAIVSDYVLGQDPILNLRDKAQNDTLNIFSTPLLNDFPSVGKSYHVDYLEDLVVISENRNVVDQLLADTKLGKTISNAENLRINLYQNLPHLVSERYVDENSAYTKAVYNGNILIAKTNSKGAEIVTPQKQSFSMNLGANVSDFDVLAGDGNVIATDQNNSLTMFRGGMKEWSKPLGAKIEFVQALDIYANGKELICAQTYNQIFLFSQDGNKVGNFPIKTDKEIKSKVTFYRWKNSGYFVFGTEDGKAHVFDSQGREIRVIDAGLVLNRPVDAWSSQGRLFYGFANDNHFHMYDADKRRMHRKFPINGKSFAGRIPNEINQYSLVSGSLYKFDQKGTKTVLHSYSQASLLDIYDENKNPVIVLKSANEIKILNTDGVEIGSVQLPFNEVADIDVAFTENGKTALAVIDGLENNVYLYRVGGNLLLEKPLEGQQKVDIRISGSAKKITTIVDQFVVQYFEN